ncbi:hypothetical protein BGW42_003881 [Actinomortierella wolfii]|nr:hypothetical protein BGW42_003881 [Actinomortierella wolfii]
MVGIMLIRICYNLVQSGLKTHLLCKTPFVKYYLSCDSSRSLPIIPDFTLLVNREATTFEGMRDSLNMVVPASKSTLHGDPMAARPGAGGSSASSSLPVDNGDDSVELRTPGMPLPILLKKAEMAVVDLKVLIRHSGLSEQTKLLLVERLESFHTRARVTGRKLQVLQTRANGCIDSLVIRNTFLVRELDRLSHEQQNARQSFFWKLLLGPVEDIAIENSNRQLQAIYQHTMGEARDQVRKMIQQSQDVLQDLDALDTLLTSIQDLVTKEQAIQRKAKDEILAILWTHIGFNRVEMRLYNENLELLQDLAKQRKQTRGRVHATLWKLTEFETELGLLREKMFDAVMDPALGPLSPKVEPDKISGTAPMSTKAEEEESQKSGNPQEEGPVTVGLYSHKNIARVLRSHIEQIDQVTNRLRDRSLVTGSKEAPLEWFVLE